MALKRVSALSKARNGGALAVSRAGAPASLNSDSTGDGVYFTALVATAPAIPVAASIFTVILYISPLPMDWGNWTAPLLGLGLTISLWLLLAPLCLRFARPESANPIIYASLMGQLQDIYSRLGELTQAQQGGLGLWIPSAQGTSAAIALEDVRAWCDDMERELEYNGLRWLLASGYINMWRSLHGAEEALMLVEPVDGLIAKALIDELSLQGSDIGNRDYLLDKLRLAVKNLSPAATAYLNMPPHEQRSSPDDTGQHPQANGNGQAPQGQQGQPGQSSVTRSTRVRNATGQMTTEMGARTTLRQVRHVINDYRDSLWEGLIRTRNRLMTTMLVTGMLAYILLSVTIMSGVKQLFVIYAAIYFLVGALVGLFGRLAREVDGTNEVSDYGLSTARIVSTPVLSGLAAVIGVLVFSLAFSALQNHTGFPTLEEIYTLNSGMLLVAAVFGLTPNLLIGMLQQKADSYKAKLLNSKPSSSSN